MRILFVNHTGAVSGAEWSLMRLVEGLRADHVVAVACPPAGALADVVDAAGVERFPVPAFEASLRLDPVHTPLSLARLGAGGVALARVTRRFGAQVIHANSTRAGLMSAVARSLGAPPVVVHVRDDLPLSTVGRAVRFVLARSARAVVAVSQHTALRFNEGLDRPLATHVYTSCDRARFDPDRVSPSPIREELGIAPGAAILGQVAQISVWKGQDTAIRALAELRRDGLDAHLLLVGEVRFAGKAVRYDNHAFLRSLHRLVEELGVRDAVHFLGQRDDVPGILRALDLSLLPSWNEPFGRVALESMAMGTPLLMTEVGGGPELVEDGVSGRLLPPKRPDLWAAAVRELLRDRQALVRMGARARDTAGQYNDEAQASAILAVYGRVLGPDARNAPGSGAAVARGTEEAAGQVSWPG